MPRQKPKPVAAATLLVRCDIACNWKLDNQAMGHINAGASSKATVGLGQHTVAAETEDGADHVQQLSNINSNGQLFLRIELKPVRDARLKSQREAQVKAEQDSRQRADQQARDKAAQEAKAVQDAQDKAEREIER